MLAFLFLLYEAAGIFANLGGGWLATRFGIPRMLATGLTLQIGGLLLLSALDPAWGAALSVAWVVAAQGIAGVAKDITKTASKSAIKATSEGGAGQLFRWVAWFTGSKNAMKGFRLLRRRPAAASLSVSGALWLMAGVLAPGAGRCALSLPRELGKAKASKSFARAIRQKPRHQSDGRRAHLPVRLARCVVRRRPAGLSLRPGLAIFTEVAGFLAAWTIGYGVVQGVCALRLAPQSRRAVARNPGSAALGRGSHRHPGRARAAAAEPTRRFSPALVVVVGPGRVRLCLRRDLVAALLSDPRLCRVEEGGGGCRLLLRRQCRRPAVWDPALGRADVSGRHEACLWGSAIMLALCLVLTFLLPIAAPTARRVPA